MFQIDPMSRTPVYEQIIAQAEKFITSGLLAPGDQMPSVRGLSLTLKINPNTIQKAYSELDLRGIIQSVPGKGCYVSKDAKRILDRHSRSRIDELAALASELASLGICEDDLIDCIRKVYLDRNLRKENEQ